MTCQHLTATSVLIIIYNEKLKISTLHFLANPVKYNGNACIQCMNKALERLKGTLSSFCIDKHMVKKVFEQW